MNFKNIEKFRKMQYFKNAYKIHLKQIFNCLVFFKSDRPVCNHLNVNFIKTTIKTIFSLKKVDSCIFNQKKFKVKETVQKHC